MIKKQIVSKVIALSLVVALAGTIMSPLKVEASAETDQINEILNASHQVTASLEKLGFSMEDIAALPQKDASFYDISLDDYAASLNIPTSITSRAAAPVARSTNAYQDVYAKQLVVINKATNQNRARGMSTMNCSFEEDFKFQFISHYMDGNEGNAKYYSEYGYQSTNLADWVTDLDRQQYRKFCATLMKSRQLKEGANVVKTIGGVGHSADEFRKSAKTVVDIGEFVYSAAPDAADLVRRATEEGALDEAKRVLSESQTLSEFQRDYQYYLENAFSGISEMGAEALNRALMAAVFASAPMGPIGISLTCAYYIITIGADVLATLNLMSLGMTRQTRVSERIMDQMEYEGYW